MMKINNEESEDFTNVTLNCDEFWLIIQCRNPSDIINYAIYGCQIHSGMVQQFTSIFCAAYHDEGKHVTEHVRFVSTHPELNTFYEIQSKKRPIIR